MDILPLQFFGGLIRVFVFYLVIKATINNPDILNELRVIRNLLEKIAINHCVECSMQTYKLEFTRGDEMKDFPDFMKNSKNHIESSQQNTKDIDGYYFEEKDGSQMAFWTYFSDRESTEQEQFTVLVEEGLINKIPVCRLVYR